MCFSTAPLSLMPSPAPSLPKDYATSIFLRSLKHGRSLTNLDTAPAGSTLTGHAVHKRSARKELPLNQRMDDYHEVARQAIMDYLKDRTTREERKEIIGEAITEWIEKKVTLFGWISIRVIVAMAFGGIVYLWLTNTGWSHK